MAEVRKKPVYNIVNGIRIPRSFSPKCVKEAFEYKPQPDDNFIVTYPKCGTTWMQNIVISIFRKGNPMKEVSEFRNLSPFIEMVGLEGVQKMPRPGSIKSHLPYNHMPYSPDAKYIFVGRNPRDVCVSLYHHTVGGPDNDFQDGTFDDFFECFLNGEVEYNDYCDHLLSWYPHRNDRNVWYTTYEKMKAEPKTVICSLADFLGQEYADAIEKDNAMMNNILTFSSFDHMKKNLVSISKDTENLDKYLKDPNVLEGMKHLVKFCAKFKLTEKAQKFDFIRKGIVGDWRNHFSEEQIKRLDAKFAEKTKGTDLGTWWSY